MSLEEAGLVQRTPRPGGRGFDYRLTTAGEELRPENLDAGLLMWFRARAVRRHSRPHPGSPRCEGSHSP